jgi:hypothetical protein
MRSFLLKISVALGIAFAMHVIAGFFSGGHTDDFYLRLTTPRAKSMIIGSSRAAQGIHPDSLQRVCAALRRDLPIFNFAFTSMASPFGETYWKAIQSKIDTGTTSGLFMICVEPYTLGGIHVEAEKEQPKDLIEEKGILYNAHILNSYPNWEYLLKHYSYGWGRLALTSLGFYNDFTELHSNGWLEVRLKVDSATAQHRANDVLYDKRNDVGNFALSPYRLHWLRETIAYLKRFGKVVMIRVPVSRQFYDFEQALAPSFDDTMQAEADHHEIEYINFQYMAESLTYKDGHHMQLTSTAIFSSGLATWLMQNELNPSGNRQSE